ncbi:MAG TPA: class I SAM-dependent methyltransferase, partial [Patescibacteria group bacterium]|nr:class I SAM-dependent methyltransferase [Patescibacteria group bacterium]
PGVAHYGGAAGFVTGLMYLGSAGMMLWGSRYHKFRMRDKLLEALTFTGYEQVLDVGCGQGLLTVAIAGELTDGIITGIDVNDKGFKILMDNARYEQAEKKIVLKTGDLYQLPFPKETFDVVVSGWALHTLNDEAGRKRAMKEMIRVLKPGGTLAILDQRDMELYEELCHEADMAEIELTRTRFWRIIPTRLLVAQKP